MKTLVADLLQINVQQQKAIATALCYSEKPELIARDQSIWTAKINTISSKKVFRAAPTRKEKLNVYCYCRQIDDGRHMHRSGVMDVKTGFTWTVQRFHLIGWDRGKEQLVVLQILLQEQAISLIANQCLVRWSMIMITHTVGIKKIKVVS